MQVANLDYTFGHMWESQLGCLVPPPPNLSCCFVSTSSFVCLWLGLCGNEGGTNPFPHWGCGALPVMGLLNGILSAAPQEGVTWAPCHPGDEAGDGEGSTGTGWQI